MKNFVNQLLNTLRNDQPYFHLVRCIHITTRLPISSRKIILTACQTGELHKSDLQNIYLPADILDYFSFSQPRMPSFIESLAFVIICPIQRSLLWMITRTCPEPPLIDESPEVRRSGFLAEISATQTIFSESQTTSYSSFFRRVPGPNDPGQWWVYQSHDIRSTFHKSMNGKVLYPAVNRNKNVSQDTLAELSLHHPQIEYARTVDLETVYAKTGIMHGGHPEVRTAWKFNNLKPRIYYCTGGAQYWASRYMKVIAVKIMEAIPSTKVKLRTDPTQFLSSDFTTDHVTAWDFSAFTSTLSELKHFIWYLARMSEADQTTVTLFDYRHGYIYDVPLFELLDEYNETANMHARFSVHRMVGIFLEENPDLYAAMNSGMLGVHGNIGFSTALHGLVICKECGVHRCVCVGDDGLGITSEDPSISLIPAISRLGVLHPEKFGLLGPADDERFIKFLKRRLVRVGDKFVLSFLVNFPITAYIDGQVGNRDRPLKFSMQDRIYKFATHVSELLWDLERYYPIISEDGVQLAMIFLNAAYQYLNLPRGGLFPGSSLRLPGEDPFELAFTLPRIAGYHPSQGDWIEFMVRHSPCIFFKAPVFIPLCDMGPLVQGYHMLPESAYVSAMEDLGFVETEKISEWVLVNGAMTVRMLSRMLRREDDGMGKALAVRVVKEVPSCFRLRSGRKGVATGDPMDLDDL